MIAVVLPIYNQEKFLARALDSLVAQTRRDWIAVCVDDGSTDATPRILADCAARDGRIRVVTKPNGGVSSARNAGLDVLKGLAGVTHVAFLDPDDLYHPQCLEVASRYAEDDPSGVVEWDYANEDLDGFRAQRFGAPFPPMLADAHASEVWNKLYPRAVVEDVRFGEDSAIAEDFAFLVELFHRHRVSRRRIPLMLGFYNENPVSNMHRALRVSDFVERRRVVERVLSVLGDDRCERMRFCHEDLPGLLKRFYRDLGRADPGEAAAVRREFAATVAGVRKRGLLFPQRGSIKDLKYYLKFLMMSRRIK